MEEVHLIQLEYVKCFSLVEILLINTCIFKARMARVTTAVVCVCVCWHKAEALTRQVVQILWNC